MRAGATSDFLSPTFDDNIWWLLHQIAFNNTHLVRNVRRQNNPLESTMQGRRG